ncbi:hypothetical protein MHC_01480 [Mycoplasma haemocanis str. Illinois]|uniref:Uncharacterized protein n=1 Tax=Mycoplasma haemocanis (strain Illinois) TaxID=1111676 RepID=H6N690_MYCHN|nr:hypothetical protein MHC_01480 [Mycoplasma haemocanis str. Illinois]
MGVTFYFLQGSKGDKHSVKKMADKDEPEKVEAPKEESKVDKYQEKIPVYKKTSDEVSEYRKDKGGNGLYLVDPNNTDWWQKRAKDLNKDDWKEFRDKCFAEVESKKSEWESVLGSSGGYYASAEYVPKNTSFDFVALCVEKEEYLTSS